MTRNLPDLSQYAKVLGIVIVVVATVSVSSFVVLSADDNNDTMSSEENQSLSVETNHAEGRISTLYAEGEVVETPNSTDSVNVSVEYSLAGEDKWVTAWSGTANSTEQFDASWEPSQGCTAGGTKYDVRTTASTNNSQVTGSVVTVECGNTFKN